MRNDVSVVIPSMKRPERLLRAVESVLSTAPGVQVVCVLEAWDTASWAILDGLGVRITAVLQDMLGTADLWNLGAKATPNADYFVVSADDVIFHDGWLEAAMEAMNALGGSGVVGFNEGPGSAFGHLAAHFMVSRKYAARRLGGTIMIPGYKHYGTDVEVTERARRDGYLAFATRARIDHLNPFYGTVEIDSVYQKGLDSKDDDDVLFLDRRRSGFPDDFVPVVRYDTQPGWGTVAVGLRPYKNVSNQFLKSWSHLLTSGLRRGDRLLDMSHAFGEPHHIAANNMVLEFLKTDCDSLLMIDDDMVFKHDALSLLRDSESNHDYDIAMGFCTFKTTPPHAVAYVLDDKQPGMPEILKGESYNALAHLGDNQAIGVDAVGLAFTLIKRRVFEEMIDEYGKEYTSWFDTGGYSEMEDMRFSRRCREHGFRMCVDTTAKIGHIGEHVYGWAEHRHFVGLLET